MVEIILSDLTSILINPTNIISMESDAKKDVIYNGKTFKVNDFYKATKITIKLVDGTSLECDPVTWPAISTSLARTLFDPTYMRLPLSKK